MKISRNNNVYTQNEVMEFGFFELFVIALDFFTKLDIMSVLISLPSRVKPGRQF
jgi:hypothetical protein